MQILSDPPNLIKRLLSGYRWESKTNKILLTFDDGPNPDVTPQVLDILDEHSIKAVFFWVGENVKKNPTIAREVVKRGHTIGNHTMSHKNLFLQSPRIIREQIQLCTKITEQTTGVTPLYFRPPKGRITLGLERIVIEMGMVPVMWSLLTRDYINRQNLVTFAIENYLKSDSIVVFHDILKSSEILQYSVSQLVKQAAINRFTFGVAQECL